MSSSSPSPVSLFQLAHAYTDPPNTFRVWPRGFKGILQSAFSYLIDQHLEATCWLKLPSGQLWQSEANHYLQQTDDSTTAYWFKADIADEASAAEEAGANHLAQTIPLPSDYKMRGEYCFLAIAEGFSLAILARRFRVKPEQDFLAPTADLDQTTVDAEDPVVNLDALKEQNQDQKHYLKVMVSINPDLMRHLLTGIYQLVEVSATAYPNSPLAKALLENWTSHSRVSDQMNFGLLDLLLANRFKLQEDMRQALTGLKRQASEASSLSTQNEELLNTMRLRDDFLNTVGQELRKPLTNIKTALTLLSSSNLKTVQRQRYLDMISTECDRQSVLVNGVLNLLQLEADLGQLPAKPVLLSVNLPGFVSIYQPLAQEKGVTLKYTIAENLPAIACPESWIKQIVTNLIDNSLKFTPTAGQVQVIAQPHGEDTIQITFHDTGVGIPAVDISRIFDCFYRGRQLPEGEVEGAGLGLTVVQQLLTYCGGSITVESQVGTGSVFRVYFPTIQESK